MSPCRPLCMCAAAPCRMRVKPWPREHSCTKRSACCTKDLAGAAAASRAALTACVPSAIFALYKKRPGQGVPWMEQQAGQQAKSTPLPAKKRRQQQCSTRSFAVVHARRPLSARLSALPAEDGKSQGDTAGRGLYRILARRFSEQVATIVKSATVAQVAGMVIFTIVAQVARYGDDSHTLQTEVQDMEQTQTHKRTRRTYPDWLKKLVLREGLTTAKSLSQLAQEHGIPRQTCATWLQRVRCPRKAGTAKKV